LTRFNDFSTCLPKILIAAFSMRHVRRLLQRLPVHFSLGNDAVNVRGVSQAPHADS
jgi:hypothetical protein